MKGFLAICVVALTVSSSLAVDEAAQKKLMNTYEKCKETNPLTPAEEEMVKKNDGVPSSPQAKCLVKCIFVDGKVLKDGKYNKDVALAFAETLHSDNEKEAEKAKQVVNHCADTVGLDAGADECEFSYKMIVCSHEKAKEIGLALLEWEY